MNAGGRACPALTTAAVLLLLAVCYAPAQTLKVYSEFSRIDPFGEVVAADKARRADIRPREILSPTVARNGYASFHLAVTAPAGMSFTLCVGQNPENAFPVTAYKEAYSRQGSIWIPDALVPVKLPYADRLPDLRRPISGQTTAVFWMDLWVPYNLRVGRYKVELQIYFDGRWIIYPMEVRVASAVIPPSERPSFPPAAIDEPADMTARTPFLRFFCAATAPPGPPDPRRTVRRFILRNAIQDMALACAVAKKHGKDAIFPPPLRDTAHAGRAEWCKSPPLPSDRGAEWYLRVRDALYRMVD